MNDDSNKNNAGLGGLPMLFPDANKLNPDYYAYEALNKMNPAPPAWVNGEFLKPPTFAWGNRVGSAPPNLPFPSYFNVNATQDLSVSLTKVMGRHTIKTGLLQHPQLQGGAGDRTTSRSGRAELPQDTVGTNPFDTSYGFANAATGAFSSYLQASNYVEGNYVYDNREAYIQDNWRVNNRLTLDYGMRFVQRRAAVRQARTGIELPARQVVARRPRRVLYRPGCAVARGAGNRVSGGQPAGAESA